MLSEADALVPVPLHWRRQWARRFNQSALLAEVIAKEAMGKRRRATRELPRAQARQGDAAAGRALAGGPCAERPGRLPRAADGKAEVAGRRLILVDDVLTSGATMDACARALLRAGAAQVDALVFARVVAGARNPI